MQEREHFNPYMDKHIVSKIIFRAPATAGKIITEINKDLKKKGIFTLPGLVSVDDFLSWNTRLNRATVLKLYNDITKGTSAN